MDPVYAARIRRRHYRGPEWRVVWAVDLAQAFVLAQLLIFKLMGVRGTSGAMVAVVVMLFGHSRHIGIRRETTVTVLIRVGVRCMFRPLLLDWAVISVLRNPVFNFRALYVLVMVVGMIVNHIVFRKRHVHHGTSACATLSKSRLSVNILSDYKDVLLTQNELELKNVRVVKKTIGR